MQMLFNEVRNLLSCLEASVTIHLDNFMWYHQLWQENLELLFFNYYSVIYIHPHLQDTFRKVSWANYQNSSSSVELYCYTSVFRPVSNSWNIVKWRTAISKCIPNNMWMYITRIKVIIIEKKKKAIVYSLLTIFLPQLIMPRNSPRNFVPVNSFKNWLTHLTQTK